MANFRKRIDRKTIFFTDHALDRWRERSGRNEIELSQRLDNGPRLVRDIPEWSDVDRFHRARASGFIELDDNEGFVVNRNPNGDYVAVTYLDRVDQR